MSLSRENENISCESRLKQCAPVTSRLVLPSEIVQRLTTSKDSPVSLFGSITLDNRDTLTVSSLKSCNSTYENSLVPRTYQRISPSHPSYGGIPHPSIDVNSNLEAVARPTVKVSLLPLRYGEFCFVSQSCWFKVVRGLVELNGHIFYPEGKYTAIVQPEWVPAYRMLAISTRNHTKQAKAHFQRENTQTSNLRDGKRASRGLDSTESSHGKLKNHNIAKETEDFSPFESTLLKQCKFLMHHLGGTAEKVIGDLEDCCLLARHNDSGEHCRCPACIRLSYLKANDSRVESLSTTMECSLDSFDRETKLKQKYSVEQLGSILYLNVLCILSAVFLFDDEILHFTFKRGLYTSEFPVVVCFADWRCAFGKILASDIFLFPVEKPFSIIDPLWNIVAKDFIRFFQNNVDSTIAPVLIVWGDVGSGKSTFCTYLINFLLTSLKKVALLDTDVGQPILSTPEMVSLTYITQPLTRPPHSLVSFFESTKLYYVGGKRIPVLFYPTTPLVDPLHYLQCIKCCFQSYLHETQLDSKDCNIKSSESFTSSTLVPLIVNTHGWVSGVGQQLIESIGEIVCGKFLVRLGANGRFEKICRSLLYAARCVLCFDKLEFSLSDSPKASDTRNLRILCWFNPAYQSAQHFPIVAPEQFFSGQAGIKNLEDVPYPQYWGLGPFRVVLSLSKIQFCVVSIEQTAFDSEQLASILPGRIVGLCFNSIAKYEPSNYAKKSFEKSCPMILARSELDICLGLGYCHSYCADAQHLVVYVPAMLTRKVFLEKPTAKAAALRYFPETPCSRNAAYAYKFRKAHNLCLTGKVPYSYSGVLAISGTHGTGARRPSTRSNLKRKSKIPPKK
ncbi:hypothetical protein IE077_001276 [Cardiosporidium cionae]|uniref:Clp1 P-loop domain-containing protein n=1 Tax=Cardiosporidium cionae TaxID=476202 RepID=A0ABQ7JDB4_9APIC|nr:hypothetical protein IE077_001276 [Cardiosporidium cionae]|eukprot:KAF8821971.1 hypothetical protein IE077_001276 [Cardiosporidium cionae]